jgi:hypothetical protein
MAGKRDKPEEIVSKLRQVEVLQGQSNWQPDRSDCQLSGQVVAR